MKRNYKKLLFLPVICTVLALGQGCAKWLDVTDNDKVTTEDYWQKREHVSESVSGAYSLMRECWRELFLWGEMRADGIELNANWSPGDKPDPSTQTEWEQVKYIDMTSQNPLIKYDKVYKVIGACNQVIKNAPAVVFLDETLTQVQCDQYVNEMKWLRSLCYFYLVRTFRDVPYVTEPTMSDLDPFAVAKTDGFEILGKLIEELKEATKPNVPGTLPPSYASWGWEQRGRATAYAAFALIADIYLWLGEYDDAIMYCDKVLYGGASIYELLQYREEEVESETGLVSMEWIDDWFTLFSKGNTNESIFEVQFGITQNNDLFGWTGDDNEENVRILVSDAAISIFKQYDTPPATDAPYRPSQPPFIPTGAVDERGESASFIGLKNWLWKYQGSMRSDVKEGSPRRPENSRNANIIIYRLADIYLMKAEALIMQGDFEGGLGLINDIRRRAGYSDTELQNPTIADISSEEDALNLLLDEKFREFLGEGKRWFDLVRTAIREDGKNNEMIIAILSRQIRVNDRASYQEKLREPGFYAYFLPIHQDEIDNAGGVLIQNPYYN